MSEATIEVKEAKQPVFTKKQVEEMIEAAVKKATTVVTPQIIVQAHNDIIEEEGVTVPPGYVPKDKQYRVHKMNDGTLELKKKSQKVDFNPTERDAAINAVDKAFQSLTREVAGQEKPKPPSKLFVNQKFRDLFQNQFRWSDAADIIVVTESEAKADDFVAVKHSTVRFKFAK